MGFSVWCLNFTVSDVGLISQGLQIRAEDVRLGAWGSRFRDRFQGLGLDRCRKGGNLTKENTFDFDVPMPAKSYDKSRLYLAEIAGDL